MLRRKIKKPISRNITDLFRDSSEIANIFVPLLPGIIAAGLVMGLTNVVNVMTKNAYSTVWWFAAIRSIGFVMFGYLAIYVGMNAAKEFGGTAVLGGIMGSIFCCESCTSSSS